MFFIRDPDKFQTTSNEAYNAVQRPGGAGGDYGGGFLFQERAFLPPPHPPSLPLPLLETPYMNLCNTVSVLFIIHSFNITE